MGKSLHKKTRLTIRFTDDQVRRLERAARVESERRRERIEEGTLGRELIVRGVDEILRVAAVPAPEPSAVSA